MIRKQRWCKACVFFKMRLNFQGACRSLDISKMSDWGWLGHHRRGQLGSPLPLLPLEMGNSLWKLEGEKIMEVQHSIQPQPPRLIFSLLGVHLIPLMMRQKCQSNSNSIHPVNHGYDSPWVGHKTSSPSHAFAGCSPMMQPTNIEIPDVHLIWSHAHVKGCLVGKLAKANVKMVTTVKLKSMGNEIKPFTSCFSVWLLNLAIKNWEESNTNEREKFTLTLLRIGSLLIISINGGLLRAVPVVILSPSIGFPCTLVASQRLTE